MNPMVRRLPTIDDVRSARDRIGALALRTPLITHPALDKLTGGRILLKAESLQRVGAFKFRGAFNKISQVDRASHPGGVVACSSGNHAQGVAAAATIAGMRSLIVMPSDAPRLKIERTRAFGGEIHLYDRVNEDRDLIAERIAKERGAAIVHPFDDPDVIAGQGTVGLELMEQAADLGLLPNAVLAPCSGGGLVGGISLAVKAARPDAEVFAVEPAGFDDMARSLAGGCRERNERLSGSICDALMAPSPGEITFEIAQSNLAGPICLPRAQARAGAGRRRRTRGGARRSPRHQGQNDRLRAFRRQYRSCTLLRDHQRTCVRQGVGSTPSSGGTAQQCLRSIRPHCDSH
jgi:threonine dehydratase